LSDPAVERITKSELTEVVITDTIGQPQKVKDCPKIRECSTATLLGEAIRRIANDESVSKLFA
jgi:ribose-phosphate pyrophosphokinase